MRIDNTTITITDGFNIIIITYISCLFVQSSHSSPFSSPQPRGTVDSQVLMNALSRLHQTDPRDSLVTSPVSDLHSPDNRSPDRTMQLLNSLNDSLGKTSPNRHVFVS